jgi:hypothetical protein
MRVGANIRKHALSRDRLKANRRDQRGLPREDIKFCSGSAREGTFTTKTGLAKAAGG